MLYFISSGSLIRHEVIERLGDHLLVADLNAVSRGRYVGQQLVFHKDGELVDASGINHPASTIHGFHSAAVSRIIAGQPETTIHQPYMLEQRIKALAASHARAIHAIASDTVKRATLATLRELRYQAQLVDSQRMTGKDQRRLNQLHAHIEWLATELSAFLVVLNGAA